ncbi:Guanine nucleotide exchange protein SMCR8 -like protein [Brachionus plicatilis]|uniref:Guanine nucleotide exchange protein SMCR8-like protein n=1 Tax=Brachionus plicatilis TaxID=10195 RepID=A0A3M7R072_BRAPC|nr:Guanine nucleotide exchange protein SMCR8 -like protein [Brachionus plicatilis]
MYGIEYSAYARAIQNNDVTASKSTHRPNESNVNTSLSDLSQHSQTSEADSLLHKIQNLSEIPEYLRPNLYIKSINCEKTKKSCIKGQYTDDFILICEFSEIEGPKPLLSIPTDGGADFDKNEYALHLMCVDFHSQNQSCDSDKKFKFTTDTTIVNFWDDTTQITSCIHHFTLYDMEARGFVRPFCMAYISNDQKAVEFFHNIKEKFSQVTELFRKGNLVHFKQELEQKCSDLKHTGDIFERWCQSDTLERSKIQHDFDLDASVATRLNSACSTEIAKSAQLSTINNLLTETRQILATTIEELQKKNWHKTKSLFSSFSQSVKSRSHTFPLSHEDNLALNIDRCHDQQYRAKIFHQALTGSTTIVPHMEPNARKERQKNMKKLHELCPDTVKQAINQLKLTQRYFSTWFHLLKYKKSSLGPQSLKHNIFWSMTAGDCHICDFSLDIDTQSLSKTILDKKCDRSTSQLFSACSEPTVYVDAKSQPTLKEFSWSNLEHYLDVFEPSDSLDDEYLSANDAEFTDQDIMYEDEYSCKKELNEYDFANSLLAIYPSSNSLAVSLSSSSVGLFYKALNSLRCQSSIADKIVQFQEFNFEQNFKNLFQKFPVALPHVFYSILKGRPLVCVSRYCSSQGRLQSVLECLSNFVPNSFYCINSLTANQAPKFTSSPHTTFAPDRPKLKCIHERKPIRLSDLKNCKLFGLSLMVKNTCNLDTHKHYDNENIEHLLLSYIPITIRNYVSILDLDELTFSGPKYTGSYLTNTVSKCAHFNHDSFIFLFLMTNLFNFYSKLAFVYEYSILFEQENFQSESLVNSGRLSTEPRPSIQGSTSSLLALSRRQKLRKLLSVKKDKSRSKFEVELEIMSKWVAYVTDQAIALDKCDFKIVEFFLKSLKMKQIYLYNLAMRKKQVKEMNCKMRKNENGSVPLIELASNGSDTAEPNYSLNFTESSDIQIPLLVEFEEIDFFKRKN